MAIWRCLCAALLNHKNWLTKFWISIFTIIKIKWGKLKHDSLLLYKMKTEELFDNIILPQNMLLYNDINCKAVECKNEIDLLYHEIITKLHTTANETFKIRHNA